MQRRVERQIRKQTRLRDAYKAAGLTEDAQTANIKLRRLNAKYKEFSKAAGLPEQRERLKVLYTDDKSKAAAESLKATRAEEAALAAAHEQQALKYFKLDSRDDLNSIVKRSTIKLANGFSCFPDGDPLTEYAKEIKPLKNYFDVAMHGSSTAVGFGSNVLNMSPRVLASVIRHSKGWNGQKIRLLSCNTGKKNYDNYCFAEELANALGVEVKAPNGVLFITHNGHVYIGEHKEGMMLSFEPNQRGRKK